MKNSSKKVWAFSLLELSIVMVIIAILIGGAVAATSLIKKSRLANAQILTKTSPVADMAGLKLWFEPVMEESFIKGEVKDKNKITQWNDLNPQSDRPYYLTKTIDAGHPDISYVKEGINSLPSVYFPTDSITNPQFALSSTVAFDPTIPNAIITPNNAFTFFVVEETILAASGDNYNGTVFYNGNIDSDGWGYSRTHQYKSLSISGVAKNDSLIMPKDTPHIVSATFAGGSGGAINIFRNGAAETSYLNSQTGIGANPSLNGVYAGFFVGGMWHGYTWHGKLSELIIFDHVLKVNERKEIEQYLSNKYNISLSN